MNPASLYVHIPFCKNICYFCSFYHVLYQYDLAQKYLDKVKRYLKKYHQQQFKTIYLGGGTPNCLSNDLFEQMLSIIAPYANEECEWSIECNPEFIDLEQIRLMHKYGLNRLSLGIQSFNDQIIKHCHRQNTKEISINKIRLLQQNGFTNLSCDLIYGFQNQTPEMIVQDLQTIKQLKIPHLSVYSLEVSRNCVFGQQGYYVDEDKVEEQLELITNILRNDGFHQYEVSNWALNKNYFCQHNLTYWLTNDWAAVGLGAYGLEKQNYYNYTGSHEQWHKKSQHLSTKEWYQQILMMGLRLKEGINLKEQKYNEAYHFFAKKLADNSLLEITPNYYLRCKNIYLLNSVLEKILD